MSTSSYSGNGSNDVFIKCSKCETFYRQSTNKCPNCDTESNSSGSKWVGFSGSGNDWMGSVDWRLRETMEAKINACKGKSNKGDCSYGYGSGFCADYNFGSSYKTELKCYLSISTHEACAGKEWKDKCSYINEQGRDADGWCSSSAFGSYSGLTCSKFNPNS